MRAGILTSVRGPNGGFKLKRGLDEVSVLEVREIFRGPCADRVCVPELGACHSENLCAAHDNWLPVADTIEASLERTSVAAIVSDPRPGSSLLTATSRPRLPRRSRKTTPHATARQLVDQHQTPAGREVCGSDGVLADALRSRPGDDRRPAGAANDARGSST